MVEAPVATAVEASAAVMPAVVGTPAAVSPGAYIPTPAEYTRVPVPLAPSAVLPSQHGVLLAAPSCMMVFVAPSALTDFATIATAMPVADTAIPGDTVGITIRTGCGIPVRTMTTATIRTSRWPPT